MRREQNVGGGEIPRSVLLRNQSGECHVFRGAVVLHCLPHERHLQTVSHEQEVNFATLEPIALVPSQFLDAFGEKIDAVPLPKRSDETDDECVVRNAVLAPEVQDVST
jgi:hypothetical protein